MDDATAHQPGDAGNILAIDKQSVHRICSGQVVLNLATAVKELVENSLDAGANSIEIRSREYGSEMLEVVDNGCGVKKDNFEGLTLKHHTSKLKDFSDLVSVDTFGFRGEALSSLCALSKLVVTTCHKDSTVGTKLEFDHSGKLLSQSPCARQTGTTVNLQSLFSTLPVRHKEFLRNLKKEFNKMIQVLYGYCIISTAVRINCTNQVGKGKKTVMVNTNGNNTMKENIANLFGAKQMQNVLELVQTDPSEDLLTEYSIPPPAHQVFSISGYVSTCEHGHGRSSTDRQFYFINKRPCDLVKVSRVVNEVYHYYNRHQYPFVVLDISLDKESVDVNVTPDKRQIFIENEKLLLAVIKSSLMKLWEPKASVFQLNQAHMPDQKPLVCSPKLFLGDPSKGTPSLPSKENLSSALANMKRSFSSAFAKSDDSPSTVPQDRDCSKPNKQRKLDSFVITPVIGNRAVKEVDSPDSLKLSPTKSSDTGIEVSPQSTVASDAPSASQDTPRSMTSSEQDLNSPALPQYSVVFEDPLCFARTPTKGADISALETEVSVDRGHDMSLCKITLERGVDSHVEDSECTTDKFNTPEISSVLETTYSNTPVTVSENSVSYDQLNGGSQNNIEVVSPKASCTSATHNPHPCLERPLDIKETCEKIRCGLGSEVTEDIPSASQNLSQDNSSEYTVTITEKDEPFEGIQRKEREVVFSMSRLKSRLQHRECGLRSKADKWCRSFRAKINPGDNTAAEEELKREISKDMFLKMKILGQFNLGFIIALLDRDLFIIDQHATDEKYNFEMLQRHTVIQSQKLIQPQRLELTAASEAILMDNLDVFHKNGFDFQISEEGEPTQRVKLVSMPVSKNWTFGKDDIDELLFMLSDSPGIHCRPSRVRMMFASRSCRKSVMIGTALDKPQMRKLIDHMAEIDQPWNCPHGRPTMRHLINLDMLPD